MRNSKIFINLFVFFALILLLYLFKPFLLNIFIAALLAVATSNINVKFLDITNGKRTLSASLTTAVLCLLFFAPFLYAVISVAKYAITFDTNTAMQTIEYIKNYDIKLPQPFSFLEPNLKESINEMDIKGTLNSVISYLANIGKMSASFLLDMLFILVFFFFANLYGTELVAYLKNALPMEKDDSEFILSEVANVMSVVFYSIIINTIIQGFLFATITGFFGYDAFLTGILYGFCSLIPVVGGMLMWLPIGLYEFANGSLVNALVIVIFSILVISVVADTFLKPLVIKFINSKLVKIPTKINELLIFFAMIAGMSTFGFWGLILGPAIVTFFISTIKLYTLLKDRI